MRIKADFMEIQPSVQVKTFGGKSYVYIALNPEKKKRTFHDEQEPEDVYEHDYNEFVTDDPSIAALAVKSPEAYLDYVPPAPKSDKERLDDAEAGVSELKSDNAIIMDAIAEIAELIGG